MRIYVETVNKIQLSLKLVCAMFESKFSSVSHLLSQSSQSVSSRTFLQIVNIVILRLNLIEIE